MRSVGDGPGPWGPRLSAVLAASLLASALAVRSTAAPDEPQRLTVPDVPYLPQTAWLCGGAALAMVLRFWGEVGVRPEDFAASLSAAGRGITTETLQRLAEARGYRALALRSEPAETVAELEKGRPLIALVAAGKRGYHYVVLLAWANRRVLLHDPAVGPFRVMAEEEWQRRWDATGRWALLILPTEGRPPARRHPDAASEREDPCAVLVRPAIETADRGEIEKAERDLAAAAEVCPDSARPLREWAGLELRRENWAAAADLSERAVARDSDDVLSWRLLATSRFLEGKPEAGLGAWNQVGEPKVDLVRIDGLVRTPFRTVYDSLGRQTDELLSPRSLRQAQRRVAALPTAMSSRVSYRPLPAGRAQLEVAIVERPTIDPLPALAVESLARALIDHAAALDLANLTSTGDVARAFWRWQPNRPQVSLAASSPRALGLPGIATAQMLWDEQSYLLVPGAATPAREERKRAALSLEDWWWADSRVRIGLAVDEWSDRGRYLSISGDVEHRLAGDRVAVGGSLAGWTSLGSRSPFYAGSLWVRARSDATPLRPVVHLDLAYEATRTDAPLALWPGAGTGLGRDLLLRAHPLLRDGIVDGPCFGPQLLRGGVEGEAPVARLGPFGLSAALFVDSARVLAPSPGRPRETFVDVGAGLRLRLPGRGSILRADLATPWGSVRPRLSVGWQSRWPE